MIGIKILTIFSQGSASKTADTSGRNISKPDSSNLRKTPGSKAKAGPSVSCLRRNSDSRNLNSDRALSPQRIRRVSSSGKNRRNQLCLIAVCELFECKIRPVRKQKDRF